MRRASSSRSNTREWRLAVPVFAAMSTLGVAIIAFTGSHMWHAVHALDSLSAEQGQNQLVRALSSAGALVQSDVTCVSGRTVLLSWPAGEPPRAGLEAFESTGLAYPPLGGAAVAAYGVSFQAVTRDTIILNFATSAPAPSQVRGASCS